ncbi:MAG: adenylate/guanylate cyclase domain-containing protein [Actinomycetota bacterium]|nr:adenylate/guanylate cyclase domain-containing protein [Actinomycetota bacterium]
MSTDAAPRNDEPAVDRTAPPAGGTTGPGDDSPAAPATADTAVPGADTAAATSGATPTRRGRRGGLRRRIAVALVLAAVVSLVFVAALNFFGALRLLLNGNEDRLVAVGESRAASIEQGIDRVLDNVSVAAADLAVALALEGFGETFSELDDEPLEPRQLAELEDAYGELVVDAVADAGLEPVTVDETMPASDAGRYVQYHYGLGAAARGERDLDLADAGDGSDYSELRSAFHPYLASLVATMQLGDLLLVDADTADVVYSAQGRIDVGTNLRDGPFADTALARAVLDDLSNTRVGETVIADYERYLPGGGRPVLFAASAVRSGTEIVGALVAELPVEALTNITTAGGAWEQIGLDEGEAYVVGPDLLLRSESRRWIEDPEGYLEAIDGEEHASLVEVFESPVGLQVVDTEPVTEALDGHTFSGVATDYLGEATFSYARLLDVAGLQWAVVVDEPIASARAPFAEYFRRLGLVVAIIVPLVVVLGIVLADRLARRIPAMVRAAHEVAAGERDPDVGTQVNDELGDLGRRLRRLAADLGRREAQLAAEYERRRELLATVLPERIVDAVDSDRYSAAEGDLVDVGTVIAVRVVLDDAGGAPDDVDVGELLAEDARFAESLAHERGIERIRADADRYLFVAGAGRDEAGADDALAYATDLSAAVAEVAAREQVTMSVSVGLATGSVAMGVVGAGGLTFAAWGEPVRQALAVCALAAGGQVLLDRSAADALTSDDWRLEEAEELVDVDGRPMALLAAVAAESTT